MRVRRKGNLSPRIRAPSGRAEGGAVIGSPSMFFVSTEPPAERSCSSQKWVMRNGRGDKGVRERNLHRENVGEQTYDALVAGMSRAVARLSGGIAGD